MKWICKLIGHHYAWRKNVMSVAECSRCGRNATCMRVPPDGYRLPSRRASN